MVRGAQFGGLDPTEAADAAEIAEAYRRNLAALCEAAEAPLGDDELAFLERWIAAAPSTETTPAHAG